MNDISGHYFIKNKRVAITEKFDLDKSSKETIIYEVIRVINGKVLFYPDHIARFENSLKESGYSLDIFELNIGEQLSLLITSNKIKNGNIKFLLRLSESQDFYAFFIPHKYPSIKDYEEGVFLSTLLAERFTPHIKQQNNVLNNLVKEKLLKTKAYEILLVRSDWTITEGSKSNFFLIKNNEIYTARETDILPGITRKYILRLCEQLGIQVIEKEIPVNDLENCNAAFISGTSPKILPVRTINNVRFDVKNYILLELMKRFDEIIEENLVILDKI
jgi:branched-chain amino acid aminotransferase